MASNAENVSIWWRHHGQATCVQWHQRQPRSAVAIVTSEVQVSAADSQTVPTTRAADMFTSNTFVQGVDNNNWGLYCRHPLLLYLRRLGAFQSDIPLFALTWPSKHSLNQGWESTHRVHLYLLGGVFYSPWHRTLGKRVLDLRLIWMMMESHENDSRNPDRTAWCSILNSCHPSKYWPCRMTA